MSQMQKIDFSLSQRILKLLTCVLICKIVVVVLVSYRDYMPPNFGSDFLQGRDRYFHGSYQWAFYIHITSGPGSLVLGLILLSEQFRLRFSKWHRCLGRIQIANILLLVAPSGLWMARYAESGAVAEAGFAVLAVATGFCAAAGWRSAVRRRFVKHRTWMSRCFVLLCSAVVLRLIGGMATVTGVESAWLYPLTAWTSWLVPLMLFEFCRLVTK